MNAKELSYGILRAAGIALGIMLMLFFLYEIQSVIVYIAVAAIISLIGRPVVIFLRQRLKIPNQIAVIIVLLLVMDMKKEMVVLMMLMEEKRHYYHQFLIYLNMMVGFYPIGDGILIIRVIIQEEITGKLILHLMMEGIG